MKKLHSLSLATLAALALSAVTPTSPAQIKAYTLEEMVTDADEAIHGQIVGRRVFRVDSDIDGPELYYTVITVEGTALSDGTATTVEITYHGGFIDELNGVHNSEAPIADDVRIGNRIVAFYKWTDNMGGEVAGNALMAMHGGLYRTVSGPNSTVALGRGDGYAIRYNTKVSDLTTAIRDIRSR